jgi:anti-sigma B factor antagonist
MSVFLSERAVGPVTVLELGEQLKAHDVPEFRDRLQELVDQGRTYLLLDCGRIQSVDSVGIGSLVGNWISIKKRGGKLGLLNPSARFQSVLKLVGLQDVIESYDDVTKATPPGTSNSTT